MRYIVSLLTLCLVSHFSYADTFRDFSRHGIFIKMDGKKIKSTKLKYGMEIDYSPKTENVSVWLVNKEGEDVRLGDVPTSKNKSCPAKIKRMGCHYAVGSKGTISPINKKYNCINVCQ